MKDDPGSCWHSNSTEMTEDIWNKVDACANTTQQNDHFDEIKKMCICNNKDFCNFNIIPDFTRVTVAGQSSSIPNHNLIFGILTLATIYYTRGIAFF